MYHLITVNVYDKPVCNLFENLENLQEFVEENGFDDDEIIIISGGQIITLSAQ